MNKVTQYIVDQIWNKENHSVLSAHRGEAFIDLLNQINLYKAFVPDLTFEVNSERWFAVGRHSGLVQRRKPSGQQVRLSGLLRGSTWDESGFIRQIGLEREEFNQMLHPPINEMRLRAIYEKGGIPVVLFPALSLPGWITWRRIIDRLRDRTPVITFQLLANRWALERRGVARQYTVDLEMRAAQSALFKAGVEGPLDLVGHSAGGTLALGFALDHPDRVHSLTLIEPGALWVLGAHDEATQAFLRYRMENCTGRITPKKYAQFLRHTLGQGYQPELSPFWPWLCLYRKNLRYRPAFYAHADTLQRLRDARFPVLLVRGAESDPTHREIITRLQSSLKSAQVVDIPGGHVPHHGPGIEVFLTHFGAFRDRILL